MTILAGRAAQEERPAGRRVGVTSLGLYRSRGDLGRLLNRPVELARPGFGGAYLGWGDRPSGRRARWLARRFGGERILLEDGFLKGYDARLGEPSQSYVVDRSGIYFRTGEPSDLTEMLRDESREEERESARQLMERLRRERLTKFNNWPDLTDKAAGIPRSAFLLLIDQVPWDASIAGAGVSADRFTDMMEAAKEEAGGRPIVVRTHPARRDSSKLLEAAAELGIDVHVPEPVNPWRLIEQADGIFTISSGLGFEALFAGRPVTCFGHAFYAGFGLTEDRFSATGIERRPVSLDHLVHVFYRRYTRYLDLHTRQPCDLETAIEQALEVRAQRNRITRPVVTIGLSPWKRRALEPFLIGKSGRPFHRYGKDGADRVCRRREGQAAVWGARRGPIAGRPVLTLEDGFIRSVGLGVDLTLPGSIAIDETSPHYDCSSVSELERILREDHLSDALLERARQLRRSLVEAKLTKYNLAGTFTAPTVPDGRLRLLVPGQVEIDRSILLGSPDVRSNHELVERARKLFPDAFIVYKPHPDVVAGYRGGGETPTAQDHTGTDGSADAWIEWCDRLETMTSLIGFEALMRGKAVGVHGMPFYAGWGLTDDRMAIPRRGRKRTLDELVAAALILYPFYVHPQSRRPCSVERFAAALPTPEERLAGTRRAAIERRINRLAVLLRDRLRGSEAKAK